MGVVPWKQLVLTVREIKSKDAQASSARVQRGGDNREGGVLGPGGHCFRSHLTLLVGDVWLFYPVED